MNTAFYGADGRFYQVSRESIAVTGRSFTTEGRELSTRDAPLIDDMAASIPAFHP